MYVIDNLGRSEMKKILIFFVIILSAFKIYASAKWVLVEYNNDNDVFFIDSNSIQKSGDSRTVWQKVNYSKRDSHGDLSSKIQRTFNCRTRESINRHLIFYDDIDNNGQVTSSAKATLGWEPISPETANWTIYKYVCNK